MLPMFEPDEFLLWIFVIGTILARFVGCVIDAVS